MITRTKPLVEEESYFVKEVRLFIKENWASVFLFVPSLSGIWVSVTDKIPLTVFGWTTTWQTLLFGISVVLATVGGFSLAHRRAALREEQALSVALEEELVCTQDQISGYLRDYVVRLNSAAQRLAQDIFEPRETSRDRALPEKCRLTIYYYDQNIDSFVPLLRHSDDPTLETFGRKTYPAGQGFIGYSWANRAASQRDELDDRAKWEANLVENYGFSVDEAKGLRMHSKSYAAVRLSVASRHIGVIVVESEKKRGVTRGTADALINSAWVEVIARDVDYYLQRWKGQLLRELGGNEM
ncbi:MAG: hypothetical protein SOW59_04585 [Corynebacterium sp.]|nr:hypothetical protein [Corynebacterium sp.]